MKYSFVLLAAVAVSGVQATKKPKPPKPPKPCKGKKCAGGGGDPHFRTLDGTLYSFHGECDLVMGDSASYASGLGLQMHARTQIVNDWSLISQLALRIGDDIIEITNTGSHYFNGVKDTELPLTLAGQYTVTKGVDMISTFEEDGSSQEVAQQMYTIHLMNEDVIRVSVFRSMITVNVDGDFDGIKGMLGTSGIDGLIGRDGVTKFEDSIQMGMDWQVNDSEPMLFHDVGGPQYPERCIMPAASAKTRRRLREFSKDFLQTAQEKCASAPADLQKLCVDDILKVGDVNIAYAYAF